MTGAAVVWSRAEPRRTVPGVAGRRTADGERLATVTTAAAVLAVPLLSPAGPGNVAPVDLFVGLAVACCLLWVGTSGHRLRFPYIVPIGVLMVGGALGALVGPLPRSGVVALGQDAILLLWCWALVNVASTPARLRVVVGAWGYGAIAWAMLLVVGLVVDLPFLTGQNASEGSRTALTFKDPNYAASYWCISIMLLWAAGLPRRRGARVAAYVLLVVALISTGSNGGIVALVVSVTTAGLLGTYHRYGVAAAAPVLTVLVLVGCLLAANVNLKGLQEAAYRSPYPFIRDGIGHGQKAVASRSALHSESVQLWREGGALGSGPVSTKTRLRSVMAPYVKEAHNDYAAALVERGAIGFLGIILLIAGFLVRAPSLSRSRLTPGFAAVIARPHALVGAVAGTLAAMAVVELLHARHVWTLFAFVAAVAIWGRR